MTKLLTFRNPQGSEENWLREDQKIPNRFTHITKVALTEAALPFIALAAVVEIVASPLFFACKRIFNSEHTFKAHIESALFTPLWALSYFLDQNLFCVNVYTKEIFVRKEARPSIPFFYDISKKKVAEPTPASFMAGEIFGNTTNETKNLVNSLMPQAFEFILVKTVYLYTYGARSKRPLPLFLHLSLRKRISEFRRTKPHLDKESASTLNKCFKDIKLYNNDSLSVQETISELKKVAVIPDYSHPLFDQKNWVAASELLFPNGAD